MEAKNCMVRVEFDTLTEAESYIKRKIIDSPRNYEAYYTKDEQLALIPGKSTSPKVYVLIKKADKRNVREIFGDTSVPVFKVSNFEWNAEHVPSRDLR